jgi:hypothetical protein
MLRDQDSLLNLFIGL